MSDTYGDNLECPHCGHIHRDSWELGDDGGECEGDIECGKCGKVFLWARSVSVRYIGKKPKERPNA